MANYRSSRLYRPRKKRCLTLSSVRNGELLMSSSKPVGVADREAEGNWVKPGRFYVVRGNSNRALVGRGGVAPGTIEEPTLYPDLLIQVETDESRVLTHFLRWAWETPSVRADVEHRSRTSAGIYKINQANLAQVMIPVPPLQEQHRIAGILSDRQADLTKLNRHVSDQRQAIDNLPSALLRQAFKGGL